MSCCQSHCRRHGDLERFNNQDDKSKAWYQDHKDSVEEKRAEYWEKWVQKSTEDLAARTLNANDGVE
jgi:hypothetical protein